MGAHEKNQWREVEKRVVKLIRYLSVVTIIQVQGEHVRYGRFTLGRSRLSVCVGTNVSIRG